MSKPQSCKTCKHMVVHPNARGERRVFKNGTYACSVEIPKPVLPDSVTRAAGYRERFSRTYVQPDWGTTCPLWEAMQ
jgi:hypothetical protein